MRSIWSSRPKSCDLRKQDCAVDSVCSISMEGASPRCMPRASMPPIVFDLPFASKVAVKCDRGNLDGEKHITDFDSFSLDLSVVNDISKSNSQDDWITSPGDGVLFVYQNRVRIHHGNGYVSEIYPVSAIHLTGGLIRSGDYLGKRTTDSVTWGLHYLNPAVTSDALSQSPGAGISVPFQLRALLNLKNLEEISVLTSEQLECGPASEKQYYRADVPL